MFLMSETVSKTKYFPFSAQQSIIILGTQIWITEVRISDFRLYKQPDVHLRRQLLGYTCTCID